ncbi:MAG: DUF1385 domain-containing protein [Ruminococcaceae bacterium]|nr:DUF1385 domain-containing protein [Oscillospiraceae bacterium]
MANKKEEKNPRLGQVGGQAILEGVMMKSGEDVAISVRAMDGTVRSKKTKHVSLRKKYKIFALPIIRGVVSFVESMILSVSTMNHGVDMLGIEEEETKFEKWLKEKFGAGLLTVLMPISIILGLLLSVALFFYLPSLISGWIAKPFGGDIGIWRSAVEGVIKIAIFVGYILLVSLMPDIRRTFEYHGAEHKSIFCYESGEELTVENVKKHKRFHPRCGTSFMFVMILIGIIIGFFIPFQNSFLRTACKLLLLPLTMGIGFEFLMYAGKHDNFLVRMLSAPGLWMQRITTKEPDDSQLEVAIKSLKLAMPEVFPDEECLAPDPKPELPENTEEKTGEQNAEA